MRGIRCIARSGEQTFTETVHDSTEWCGIIECYRSLHDSLESFLGERKVEKHTHEQGKQVFT